MPSTTDAAQPNARLAGVGSTATAPKRGLAIRNTSMATIDAATVAFTTFSGSATVSWAPTAEVTSMIAESATERRVTTRPSRANRAVADAVMKVTANMLVATAVRGDRPSMIITGTFTSEL